MEPRKQFQLIDFLHEDLQIPGTAIALALRHSEQPVDLPMVLWHYGLISIAQLEQIFDWSDNQFAL